MPRKSHYFLALLNRSPPKGVRAGSSQYMDGTDEKWTAGKEVTNDKMQEN